MSLVATEGFRMTASKAKEWGSLMPDRSPSTPSIPAEELTPGIIAARQQIFDQQQRDANGHYIMAVSCLSLSFSLSLDRVSLSACATYRAAGNEPRRVGKDHTQSREGLHDALPARRSQPPPHHPESQNLQLGILRTRA
jgi:hypothetical protein